MKKRTTKLISILLTLVMLLGLLPTTAFAAEKETIPSMSATVTLPTAGAHPVETGTPGDSSYKIIKVSFSKKDPETGVYTSLESTDTFEAGKTYMVNVLFRANSGYKIDRNTVSASINGQNAAWWSTISDGWDSQYYYIEYTVPEDVPAAKTPITSVKVSDVTVPVIGATPDFGITLTSDGAAFDEEEGYDGVAWYKVNKVDPEIVEWEPLDEETIFGAGLYELRVCLKADVGYEFTDATKFYYNDDELPAWHDTYESNYDWWADECVDILLYFTLEESVAPIEITSLSATVTEPVAGASPSFEAVAGGEGYTVEVEWESGTAELYPGDDYKFKAGEKYYLYVAFNAKEGYEFTNSVTITINGKPAEEKGKNGDTVWGLVTYTLPADTTVTIEMKTGDKVDDFTGAAEVGLDCLVYHNLLVADVEVQGFRNEQGKLLFTVDDETGVVTIVDGVTEEDAISYELPPEESAAVLEDYGIEMTKVILTFVPEGPAAPNETYTVSFDANGGEGTMANVTGISGEYTLPANGFTAPNGKQFKGWATSASGTVISDASIGVSANTTLYAIWEDIPTAPTATIVVMKQDSNQQPLAGATFTLTMDGNTQPDYTAVSGADGLVTFTNVAEGSYTLAESEAPEGYVKDNTTWAFNVGKGLVFDAAGELYDNDYPLTVINDIVPAPQTATIVVMKWDSNKQPLAGATFTLTVPGSIEPAYTAVSGADGLVTFTGVADGSYTLAESEAPAGYIKDNATWTFNVRDGVVSDNDGTPYDNSDPLRIANEPALAPELPDIVIWKTDGGQNYIAGATFTLTKERENAPAYTATSDEDGKVLFEGVADGIYILAETAAPAGYIKTDVTYKFLVENGEVSLYEDDDPVAYEDQLSIANEPVVTVTLPITKVVAKGGTVAPGQQTFTFKIKEFGNSNYDVSLATILENTITTNGVGSYEGVLKFTLTGNDVEDILSEGLIIVEKNDGATNWTYDTKEWTVYANNAATSGEQWSFLNDDIAPNGAERATFTNTYTKNASSGGGGGGSSGGSSGSSSSSSKPVLNKEDHMAFLQGYADGTFRPEKNMTRAQVTVMFARLLVEKMEVGKTYSNSFSDVPADYWAANEIGYMEKFGIINGFTDGTFRPNDPVTRAQFAAIACRFEELTEGTKTFSDVPADHWAAKYISYAAERGWVGGFTDGTFRPNNYITRAQVAAVTCRLLERNADEKYIEKHFDDLTYTFSDMTEQHFAYWYALEASNGHDYTKKADKETWSSLLK